VFFVRCDFEHVGYVYFIYLLRSSPPRTQ